MNKTLQKKKKIIAVGIALTALCLTMTPLPTQAQSDKEEVTIKTTHVAGNVYMLVGQGGNMGASIGEDGTVLIDDQFAPLADKIKAALKSAGGGELRFVLNTHWHGDHTGGNEIFGKDATIIAHDNVRERLTNEQVQFGRTIPARAKNGWPVITFSSELSIHFNGEEIKLMHFPNSHTDGDGVVFFPKSNVIHTGDLLFNGMFPFVDLDHGGDVLSLTTNVSKIIDMAPAGVRIIPGHGPLATVEDLKAYHRMLKATVATVQSGIDAGKTLEEITSAGFDSKWDSWNWSFISTEKWIETIHTSLTR